MSIKDKIPRKQRKDEVEEEEWHGTTIHEYDSIPGPPRSTSKSFKFQKDFRTGFGFLLTTGILCFVVIPFLLFMLKIGLILTVPFVLLGAIILLIALLGRIINFIKDKT